MCKNNTANHLKLCQQLLELKSKSLIMKSSLCWTTIFIISKIHSFVFWHRLSSKVNGTKVWMYILNSQTVSIPPYPHINCSVTCDYVVMRSNIQHTHHLILSTYPSIFKPFIHFNWNLSLTFKSTILIYVGRYFTCKKRSIKTENLFYLAINVLNTCLWKLFYRYTTCWTVKLSCSNASIGLLLKPYFV